MSQVIRNRPRSGGRRLEVRRVGRDEQFEYYTVGECRVLQSHRLHFSISHPDRYPTWDEIAAARYALLPKLKDCVMVLPPDDQYANVHEYCFHVHLLRDLAPGGRFHNPESW